MLKIIAYLKKHIPAVLIVLVLLFGQVYCDLALPQYTSDIVDVGIQQGGIKDAVPEYISGETLGWLELYMKDSEITKVEKAYEVDKSEDVNKAYKKAQPDKEKNDKVFKYVGDEEAAGNKASVEAGKESQSGKDAREELNNIFKMPMVYVYMAEKTGKVDLNMLAMAVESGQISKEKLIGDTEKKMKEYTDGGGYSGTLVEQAAIAFVGTEYDKLGVDKDKIQMDYLWHEGLIMIILTAIMILTAMCVGFIASRVGAQIGRDTRRNIFRKVISFSRSEMDRFSIASLITRSTNDIQQVQMVIVILLRVVMMAPIMGIGACIKVIGTRSGLGWITICAVAAIFILVAVLLVVAIPKFRIMQSLIDRINLVSKEIITGVPVIRAFSREDYEEERFGVASENLRKTQVFTQRTMAFMMPAMMVIMNIVSVGIVWFGSKGVDLGNLQVGDMIAFITYTMQVVISFMMLTVAAIIVPRAGVAAERIDEVLATEAVIKDPDSETVEELGTTRAAETAGELAGVTGGTAGRTEAGSTRAAVSGCPASRVESSQLSAVTIAGDAGAESVIPVSRVEFKNVYFKYQGAEEDLLKDITFTAEPGQTTAIIGSTGSGKSTLVNLIPRFFDVTSGSVSVGGHDVRNLRQSDLRDIIGYVPQKGILFSGDIRSNIKFASDSISDDEMQKAADIAQASEFIYGKEDGFESHIAQGGSNVSGGQKQRLSIARAIAKNPEIYIFDDSFSALDYKTDAKLRRELSDAIKGDAIMSMRSYADASGENAQAAYAVNAGSSKNANAPEILSAKRSQGTTKGAINGATESAAKGTSKGATGSAAKGTSKGATVIIVAQRIATILNADKIIVLDEGRIAGIGTHKQLLADCDIYREIAESQLSEEELAAGSLSDDKSGCAGNCEEKDTEGRLAGSLSDDKSGKGVL